MSSEFKSSSVVVPTNMELLNVLMVGVGEYTTGIVAGAPSASDKNIGVVALSMFDLRRRGKVGKLAMVGTNGSRYPNIREHFKKNISAVYNNLDVSFDGYPEGAETNREAYKAAIDKLKPGDAITIFTPDDTHFPMAMYAIERGVHVMVAKPTVQHLEEHQKLVEAAREKGVYVFVEHHKRFDPTYSDAQFRAQKLGDFNYFYSYMSQPKFQLETFKSWVGQGSDISFYLNSHHIDQHASMVLPLGYLPTKVTAYSSKGVATDLGYHEKTEDTITVLVQWVKTSEPAKRGTAVYTASWTAPHNAGVHSQQRFHYLAAEGEINVDQAKRGYEVADETAKQLKFYNPFYMRYAPDENGDFNGQSGYGYVSMEKFVDACRALNAGKVSLDDLDARNMPTIRNTIATTAILEAGRVSIDEKREVGIQVAADGKWKLV